MKVLAKAHVKTHARVNPSGVVSTVLEHERKVPIQASLFDMSPAIRIAEKTINETEAKSARSDYQKKRASKETDADYSRHRPFDMVVFEKPFVGPTGAKLMAYEWQYQWIPNPDMKEDGPDYIRVSDWGKHEINEQTGRQIVHQFQVELPDQKKTVTVSAETAAILTGLNVRKIRQVGMSARLDKEKYDDLTLKTKDLSRLMRFIKKSGVTPGDLHYRRAYFRLFDKWNKTVMSEQTESDFQKPDFAYKRNSLARFWTSDAMDQDVVLLNEWVKENQGLLVNKYDWELQGKPVSRIGNYYENLDKKRKADREKVEAFRRELSGFELQSGLKNVERKITQEELDLFAQDEKYVQDKWARPTLWEAKQFYYDHTRDVVDRAAVEQKTIWHKDGKYFVTRKANNGETDREKAMKFNGWTPIEGA
jgi:hypothetical protein